MPARTRWGQSTSPGPRSRPACQAGAAAVAAWPSAPRPAPRPGWPKPQGETRRPRSSPNAPPSFRGHLDLDGRPAAARGYRDELRVVRRLEVDVHDGVLGEEAVHVGVVERLGAHDVHPGREAADEKVT